CELSTATPATAPNPSPGNASPDHSDISTYPPAPSGLNTNTAFKKLSATYTSPVPSSTAKPAANALPSPNCPTHTPAELHTATIPAPASATNTRPDARSIPTAPGATRPLPGNPSVTLDTNGWPTEPHASPAHTSQPANTRHPQHSKAPPRRN